MRRNASPTFPPTRAPAARPVISTQTPAPRSSNVGQPLPEHKPNSFYDGCLLGGDRRAYPPGTPLQDIPVVKPNNGETPTVIFVNGMFRRTKAVFNKLLPMIADGIGENVVGLYNDFWGPKEGQNDIDRSQFLTGSFDPDDPEMREKLMRINATHENKAVDSLALVVYQQIKSGQPVRILGHSQGAAITSVALALVRNQLMDEDGMSEDAATYRMGQVTVETFGGGCPFWIDGPRYFHYVNTEDPWAAKYGVPRGDSRPGKDAVIVKFTDEYEPHDCETYLKHYKAPPPTGRRNAPPTISPTRAPAARPVISTQTPAPRSSNVGQFFATTRAAPTPLPKGKSRIGFYDGCLLGGDLRAYPPGTPLQDIPVVKPKNCNTPTGTTVIFVNGMYRTKHEVSSLLSVIADGIGENVVGLYNGFFGAREGVHDIVKSGFLTGAFPKSKVMRRLLMQVAARYKNKAVDSLAPVVYQQIKSGQPVRILGHSQGAAITSVALALVHDQLMHDDGMSEDAATYRMGQVTVETIGGGCPWWIDGPRYFHYVNTKDTWAALFGVGKCGSRPGKDASIVKFTEEDEAHKCSTYLEHYQAPPPTGRGA